MKVILAVVLSITFSVNAQDKRFPTDEPVLVESAMCRDLESARILADEKMQVTARMKKLVEERKCGMVRGVVVYRKKVYENDGWTVWEVQYAQYTLYEATDWKPQKKGVET